MGYPKKTMGFVNMKSKQKIYILHGWTYSTERWSPFVNELENNGFTVTMLKIPGLTAALNEVWNIGNYVDWLHAILTKDPSAGSGQENKVTLLGHSNGGLISLAYALKYPDKVGKLILIDSTGIYHKELSIRLKRWIFAIAAKTGKRFTSSTLAKKFLYKLARAHDYEKATPIVRETMKNLISEDCSQFLKNLRISTTIIWGENDQVTSVKDGRVMEREIKNSKLFIIKNARHSPQLTHSRETADIIINNI